VKQIEHHGWLQSCWLLLVVMDNKALLCFPPSFGKIGEGDDLSKKLT